MGTNPFLKNPFLKQSGINRRRSTRVEYVTPLFLSGRDAAGQMFREESVTKIVNLHGAKVKTTHEILIGMQVGIENPQNGASVKGVCVRIEEDVPEENAHYIAVQFVKPGNIWELENPPADWEVVAANMSGSAAPPVAPVPSVRTAGAVPDRGSPIIESQEVAWEQQSADLVESALQILRQQIQAVTAAALGEFEKGLQVLEREAGERLEQRAGKTVTEVSTLIQTLQEDMASEIIAQTNRVADAAEQSLRARVAEILAPLTEISSAVVAHKPVETFPRK
jgi:hypothetical protein